MKNKTAAEIIGRLRDVGVTSKDLAVIPSVGKVTPETLSALSNDAGGLLIVGLSDDFQVTKQINTVKEQKKLIDACCKLTPVVKPEIDFVEFEDRMLLFAKVPALSAKKKPCFITKVGMYQGSFTRLGHRDIRLDNTEVDEIVASRKRHAWDTDPVEGATLEDLDESALQPYLANRKADRKRTFADGTEKALQRLGIMSDDHPTLAALLAFGKYPQQFFPRLVVVITRFKTYDVEPQSADGLLDQTIAEGTIPQILQTTVANIQESARSSSTGPDATNFDAPEYPADVLREIILNALLHRSYAPPARALPVRVNVFPDRLEVVSPGTMRNSARNERLAAILNVVEFPDGSEGPRNIGSGLASVRSKLATARMPDPTFKSDIASFTVVLHRARLSPLETEPSALERVQKYLDTKQSAGTSAIVEALGLSRTSVQNSLNKLIEQGKVEATQPFRSPRQTYRLKK